MPICAVQTQCGGCPNLDLDSVLELEGKVATVKGMFANVGIDFTPCYEKPRMRQLGYRSRIRMACVDGRIDFFNTLKKNGCAVLNDSLFQAAAQLIEQTKAAPELIGVSGAIELRVSDADDRIGLRTAFDFDVNGLKRALDKSWVLDTPSSKPQSLTYELLEDTFVDVPLRSFVQVNQPVMRQILFYLQQEAESLFSGGFSLLDLFSGFGPYTHTLDHYLTSAQLVEVNTFACTAAKDQLEVHVEVFDGPVEENIARLQTADLVIVNPGRAGLKETAELIEPLVGRALIYISCNPETLAPDLEVLASQGLQPVKARCFDMFPGTQHIETVVTCAKSPRLD